MKKSFPLFLLVAATAFISRAQTEATPPAAVPVPPPDPYESLVQYDFGQDRAPLNGIDGEIRSAASDAAQRAAIETKLVAALGQAELRPGAQDYLCRTLVMIGTARCVPALAKLLADERGADYARFALERIPVPEAGEALRTTLPRSAGRARIGIVNSLGERREPASIQPLAALLKNDAAALAAAAAQALGKIGNAKALAALVRDSDHRVPLVADAWLNGAEAVAKSDPAAAAKVFRQLLDSGASQAARDAAFVGFAQASPAEANARLLDLFAESDPASAARAVQLIRRARMPGFAQAASDRLPALPATTQLALLALLADLADPVARPAVLHLLGSDDAAVRVAAIDALKSLPADEKVLSSLLRLAASGPKAEAAAARKSLMAVRGDTVDATLLKGVAAGTLQERAVCVAVLGERQAAGADAALFALRADPEPEIRRAALKALETVVKPEHFKDVVAWMVDAPDAQEVREAERLVVRMAERVPNHAEVLLAADAKAGPAAKERLARALAVKGGAAALEQVRKYAASGQPELEMAALRALGTWPDASPLGDLLQVATNASDARRIHFAVQGCLQQLPRDTKRTVEEKAALCGVLLGKATQVETRRLILSALPDYAGPKALEVTQAYAADADCGAEARAALRRLRQAGRGSPGLTSSHNAGDLKNATDGNPGSRWTTGTPMVPGMWLLLDLHATCMVRRVVLDAAGSAGDYPRGYQVFVGDAPDLAGEPALTGQGTAALTEMSLEPPRRGRYVKVVQTGAAAGTYWSVHELKVDAELAEDAAP